MTNRIYVRGRVHYGTAAEMIDRIEELEAKVQSLTALLDNQLGTPCEQVRHQEQVEALEAKLAESEARSEILETLIMDVAADLYDNVPAHKIDQRIGDVMKQLDEEGEDQ